jgi:hypothetical protein
MHYKSTVEFVESLKIENFFFINSKIAGKNSNAEKFLENLSKIPEPFEIYQTQWNHFKTNFEQ